MSEERVKPMTLAYLTSAYARASDSFIRGEVLQLRARGHTVHTFSVREPGADERVSDEIRREHANTEYLLRGGVRGVGRLVGAGLRSLFLRPGKTLAAAKLALRTGTPGLKGRLWPWAYLLEAAYLAERLRAKGVQHLHNHIGEGSAAVAMLASLLADVPYSLTVHGPNEFDRPQTLALDEKAKRAAFVVAVSEYGRSQLFRWTDRADWPRIHVVHCGVNGTFLHQPPAPGATERRLVCVGRLAEQKGQLLLVDAARTLAREGLEFEIVLIGDGPMRGPIEKAVAEYGLSGRVKIAGWKGATEVRQELIRSRALVLPSFAEGLPVVIMEALALGRPVISTYVAGIPELVRDDCGWLVPAGSAEALADAMREALTAEPERLERMGRAGAARVAARHDAAVEAGKLAELFEASV